MAGEEVNRAAEITDIHVHVQPWEELQPAVLERMQRGRGDWEEILAISRDPARLLDYLDRVGVYRAGIINYPAPDVLGFSDETSLFSARYCAELPSRLIAFGGVHPRFTKDPAGDVNRLADLGIRALKLHPPHQIFGIADYREKGMSSLEGIYAACQERRLPVMIHTGTSVFPGARSRLGEPIGIDDVATDFPELRIIVAHGGRPLWPDQAIFLIRRFPNVHMEISGIPPRRLLHYFPRLEQYADKVLFGSDWPGPGAPGIDAILEELRAVPLSDEARRKIMGGNARRLFP